MMQGDLFVPDRFDMLQRYVPKQLNSIVVPVEHGLKYIRELHVDLKAAGRGGFLILRGDSGCGKSTFVSTLDLFLGGVELLTIPREKSISEQIRWLPRTDADLRVIVAEGRDAMRDVLKRELEAALHDINAFVRSDRGERTLVVWPANADDLEQLLIDSAQRVGADSLLGVRTPSFRFTGPPREQYLDIANRTIATLNQGASLSDLGVSAERAEALAAEAGTIGRFLGLLRSDLVANKGEIEGLLTKERCRLWVVVASGTDAEGDIAGLTRGTLSSADIERLMGATNANIVQDLKRYPEKLGILSAVLDAKILQLPMVTASAIARDFKDKKLLDAMSARALVTASTNEGVSRLADSDIARAFRSEPMGTRVRGGKPGPNTVEAFRKLAEIAATNDSWLNATIGAALKSANFISKFELEKDFGSGLARRTDIVCNTKHLGIVRLEVMWRSRTGRAEIANYVLGKLYNYGRAIGFLN